MAESKEKPVSALVKIVQRSAPSADNICLENAPIHGIYKLLSNPAVLKAVVPDTDIYKGKIWTEQMVERADRAILPVPAIATNYVSRLRCETIQFIKRITAKAAVPGKPFVQTISSATLNAIMLKGCCAHRVVPVMIDLVSVASNINEFIAVDLSTLKTGSEERVTWATIRTSIVNRRSTKKGAHVFSEKYSGTLPKQLYYNARVGPITLEYVKALYSGSMLQTQAHASQNADMILIEQPSSETNMTPNLLSYDFATELPKRMNGVAPIYLKNVTVVSDETQKSFFEVSTKTVTDRLTKLKTDHGHSIMNLDGGLQCLFTPVSIKAWNDLADTKTAILVAEFKIVYIVV